MIGNLEDQESASLAIAAAARGVFVLAGTAHEELVPEPAALVRVALVRQLATNQFANTKVLSRAESDALQSAADFARVYEALKEEGSIEQSALWKDVAFAHPTPSTEHPDGYHGYLGVQEVVAPGYETLNIVEDALFKAAQGQTSVEEAIRLVK
jgi:type II secretory ATPase GspE/PulE/Tfp pilus assembly ATPase PilB-like protein